MVMNTLTDKVAIVTGGGRGLGRAMVTGLVQAGARVVATAARSRAEIESLSRELGEDRVLALVSDVTMPGDCEEVAVAARRRFGRLDILVNNAGRGMRFVNERFLEAPEPFWKADPDAWRTVIDTNVNGPFLMARSVLPGMLEQGWGRIINISMNHSTMHRRGFSPYGHSKAALESETIIWAQDLAGTGVTVNALLPGGATATGMIPDDTPAEIRESLLRPEVMVLPLVWLASVRSDGVTGLRFNACRWDEVLGIEANAARSAEPAGWVPGP